MAKPACRLFSYISGLHMVYIASEKSTLMNLLNTNILFHIATNLADIHVILFGSFVYPNGDKTSSAVL